MPPDTRFLQPILRRYASVRLPGDQGLVDGMVLRMSADGADLRQDSPHQARSVRTIRHLPREPPVGFLQVNPVDLKPHERQPKFGRSDSG